MMHLSLLCCRVVLVLGVAASFAAAAPQKAAAPKPPTNDDCLACHSDAGGRARRRPVGRGQARDVRRVDPRDGRPRVRGLPRGPGDGRRVPARREARSRRSARPVTRRPSPRTTRACTRRRGGRGGNLAAATCADCHGSHDIKPSADPASRTHHLHAADTCGRCHGDEEIIKRGKIAIGNVVDAVRGQHPRQGAASRAA